jgi:hypothetical protein
MSLRTKLLALSLLTLLLPWSGWKLLQELEQFLREAQEGALLASARTMSGVLPVGFQTRLLYLSDDYLPRTTGPGRNMRSSSAQPMAASKCGCWREPMEAACICCSRRLARVPPGIRRRRQSWCC